MVRKCLLISIGITEGRQKVIRRQKQRRAKCLGFFSSYAVMDDQKYSVVYK